MFITQRRNRLPEAIWSTQDPGGWSQEFVPKEPTLQSRLPLPHVVGNVEFGSMRGLPMPGTQWLDAQRRGLRLADRNAEVKAFRRN